MASCPLGRPAAKRRVCPVRLRLSAGREPHALSTRPYTQWLNALKIQGGSQANSTIVFIIPIRSSPSLSIRPK